MRPNDSSVSTMPTQLRRSVGVDQLTAAPDGSMEILERVEGGKHQVSVLRQGGGFVFQQVHNILADVPPQNIVAMFDAARA